MQLRWRDKAMMQRSIKVTTYSHQKEIIKQNRIHQIGALDAGIFRNVHGILCILVVY